MQAPENPKDVVEVLGIDANPVILNGKDPAVLPFLRGDPNDRRVAPTGT